MLFDLFRSGGDKLTVIIGLCSSIFVVFCTLPIHEFAHALVATKLGDDTARLKGRLTLNPLAHIDPIGALMIILVGVGYAKPVPVNMRRFKNKKAGMALTALAGPVSNLLMALVFMFLSTLFNYLELSRGDSLVLYISSVFFYYAAYINVSLAVFNFLPIPPLDGSRVASVILPDKYYYKIMQYERYIMIAVLVLWIIGALSVVVGAVSGVIMKGLSFISALPFSLLG